MQKLFAEVGGFKVSPPRYGESLNGESETETIRKAKKSSTLKASRRDNERRHVVNVFYATQMFMKRGKGDVCDFKFKLPL